MSGSNRSIPLATALLLGALVLSATVPALAADRPIDVSLLGGAQALNQSDTGLPEAIVNVPATLALGWSLHPSWAVEGEVSWLIPVRQSVDLGAAGTADRKTPDILLYQASVIGKLPFANTTWAPYLAAGAGAMTMLSSTDADRLPKLANSQTAFAINFGAGARYALNTNWGLRADYREFAAFPASDTPGLSANGKADAIWMERGSLGLSYQF